MGILGDLFRVFSRRNEPSEVRPSPLTNEFRNRYLMLLRDLHGPNWRDLLMELHNRMSYLHGTTRLSDANKTQQTPVEDVLSFLSDCSDAHFLDSIELVFGLKSRSFGGATEENVVEQINEFLQLDNLPYYVTESVWEDIETMQFGHKYPGRHLRESPMVICKNNDVLHETAIEPALAILRKQDLLNANEEFMAGLKDYRQGKYRDSVTKCGSSLESVLKVICARNKFPYSETDTVNRLLAVVLENSSLAEYWQSPLTLIATIRNRLSSSHGAGTVPKTVTKHVALYVVNSTASAILLLHDEAY